MSPEGYRMQSEDTTYEVEQLLIESYRRMTPAQKAGRIAEDCRALEVFVISGIRARHPHATDREIRARLAELRLGRDLAAAAYGSTDVTPDR